MKRLETQPMEGKSIGVLLQNAKKKLLQSAFPQAAVEAQWLVAELCSLGRYDSVLYPEKRVDAEKSLAVEKGVEQLASGMPLAYITRKKLFAGLELEVGPDVLIPRPETEEFAYLLLSFCKERLEKKSRWLDLGTGSGCLALAIAKSLPDAALFASDSSEKALEIAKRNSKRAGLEVEFRLGDWTDPWQGSFFDCVISNPPYVGISQKALMNASCLLYEPSLALFAPEDGLGIYKKFSHDLLAITRRGALVAFEIGYRQSEALFSLFKREGWMNPQIFKDMSGRDRFFFVERE